MKKTFFIFVAVVFFPAFALPQAGSAQGQVVNISLQAIDAGIGSFTNSIGNQDALYRFATGLSLDYNPMPRIFLRLNGNWNWGGTDNGWTVSGGVGYAFESDYYASRPYTNVFVSDQPLGGGWVMRTTTVEKGTCQSLSAKIIEAGIEKQFLNRTDDVFPGGLIREVYQQQTIQDAVLYVGYRWGNYYTMSLAVEPFTFYARGLIGFKNRDIQTDTYTYSSGLATSTSHDRGIAVGCQLGVEWYIVTAGLYLYNGDFRFDCGFRIPLTFVSR